jgi:DnaJ-class molecular chaperone
MRWRKCTLARYLKDEDFYETAVLESEAGWASLRCAFCKGRGMDLGVFGQCPSCGGRKVVALPEPIIPCAFCDGSGRMHSQPRMVCVVCRGKGAVSINEPLERCPSCDGTGKAKGESQVPCNRCSGKGVVRVAAQSQPIGPPQFRRQFSWK